MPNVEIMQEWVRRLRSGDYEQGAGQLHLDGKFCCLGVLCEIAAEVGIASRMTAGSLTSLPETLYNGAATMPGQRIANWAGLDTSIYITPEELGRVNLPLSMSELAHRNDDGASFAELADLIEREWITPHLPAINATVPDSPSELAEAALTNA